MGTASLAVNSFAVVGLEIGQQPREVHMRRAHFQRAKVSTQIDHRQYGYGKALLMYVTHSPVLYKLFKFDVPEACNRTGVHGKNLVNRCVYCGSFRTHGCYGRPTFLVSCKQGKPKV